jgi:hypothetical protein
MTVVDSTFVEPGALEQVLDRMSHVGSHLEWTPGPVAGQTLAIEGGSLGGS